MVEPNTWGIIEDVPSENIGNWGFAFPASVYLTPLLFAEERRSTFKQLAEALL